jgi:hypothetical protein
MHHAWGFRRPFGTGVVTCLLVAGWLTAAPAAGELYVYEPFDYPAGEQLVGKSGGTGFTGAWRDQAFPNSATIQAGSIAYPGLTTSGNSVLMTGEAGSLQIFRNHVNVPGDDGTTTWISFLGQRLGAIQDPPVNPNNPYPRGVNVSFYNTEGFAAHGREQFAVGSSSGGPTNDWAFIGHGQVANILPASTPPVPYGGAPPAFVVLRIDHHGPPNLDGPGNNDDVYFFVNPNPDVEPAIETANAKRLGTEPNSFDYAGLDYVRPFVGNTNGAQPFGELLWDELRIGSLFSDVSPGGVSILPGDTDQDGIPGEFPDDFTPIRDNFQKATVERTLGDLVNDDFVDFLDYRQWKTAFTAGGGNLAEVDLTFLSAPVPEPAAGAMVLAACGVLVGFVRRR